MRILITTLLLFCSTVCGAITIDDFSTAQTVALNSLDETTKSSSVTGSTFYGGMREVSVQQVSAATGMTLTIGQGSVMFSQNALVQGRATLTWRFDSSRINAPQGVDLTQDGSTRFRIGVRSFDYAFGNAVTLRITVFDARDPTLQSASVSELKLTQVVPPSNPFTGPYVEFPFASFTQVPGSVAPASFKNAGAIRLSIISDATDSDLSLAPLVTDGACSTIHDATGRIVDLCGVCGGDDSSCKDCAGVPNGASKLDRCNICGGDGMGCISCIERDQSALLAALDGGAKKQEKIIRDLLVQVMRSPKRKQYARWVASSKSRAHMLQLRNWTVSWTLPRTTRSCTMGAEFCAKVSTVSILDEYRRNAEEIFKIHQDVSKRVMALRRNQPRQVLTLIRQGAQQYKANIAMSDSVPTEQFTC